MMKTDNRDSKTCNGVQKVVDVNFPVTKNTGYWKLVAIVEPENLKVYESCTTML